MLDKAFMGRSSLFSGTLQFGEEMIHAYDVKIIPLYNSHGIIENLLAVARDNTYNRLKQELLITDQARAQQYLDIAGVMFIAIDRSGKIAMVNAKAYRILGYDEIDLLGKDWFGNLVTPDHDNEMRDTFEQAMNNNAVFKEFQEYDITVFSGEKRIIVWHNSMLFDDDGNTLGIVFSEEDITEKRKYEQALASSEERFRLLSEVTFEGIVIHDNGKVINVNQAFSRLFGYHQKELAGEDILSLIIYSEDQGLLAEY